MPRRYEVDPQGPFIFADSDFSVLTPFKQTDAEIAAGVTPTNYAYAPGVLARYGGTVAASAATNTVALQGALNSNQQVDITENGTYLFNDGLTFNDNNIIQGQGKGTVLKWNVTSKSLFKGNSAASTRRYRFGMRDVLIDNTNRSNAGVIAIDCENLSIGAFYNVEVQNVECAVRIDGSIGAFYNVFVDCGFLAVVDGIQLSTLGNENYFIGCRVGDCTNGVIGDDNSSNFFSGIAIETFTARAVDLGNVNPALYYSFIKPRIEDGPTGFRLNNANARTTTIVGPHFQTISVANIDPAAIGLDTLILSGEINSPELRTNLVALGQGGIDNAQWAYLKATAASEVSAMNASNSGPADIKGSDIYANRFFRTAGAASGAASTTTFGNVTATTVGAAGGASALPATPLGYMRFFVGTTAVKVPYYND